MRVSFRLCTALAVVALPCAAQTLAKRVDAILASGRAASRSSWGIKVVELATGKTLYDRNGSHWFVPASNTKLFSTSLALTRLGPDYRFHTTVRATSEPDGSGRIAGDVVLAGSGDPTLSSRTIPYVKDDPQRFGGNPLAALEELADQVAARGVRLVEGSVVGDDTRYVWEPYPDGWSADDPLWEYGAPVSALTINDNCFQLTLHPGAGSGDPVSLSMVPPLEHYIIHNLVRTAPAERIRISRELGSRELVLRGALPPSGAPYSTILAIDDPALYAARALTLALVRRGITVRGEPHARHREASEPESPAAGVELARRSSPPLVETLRIVDKVSQNLEAELVLRAAGYERRTEGTRQAAIEELKAFLEEAGALKDGQFFEDASGLSRLNLISPDTITRLLVYMHKSSNRDAWLSLLPVGGEDGTLASRFAGASQARNIRAKTGSLTHVNCLSGYVESRRRGRLAFSIMVNNSNAPSAEIRGVIDKIALILVQL